MSVKFEEIRNSITPITLTLQIFGLRPYYATENGLRFSFWKASLTIFYIVSYFVICYSSYKSAREYNIRESESQIINIVSIVYQLVTIFVMLDIFGYTFLNIRKHSHFLGQIYKIVQYMEMFKLNSDLKIHNNYIFWYSLQLVLLVVFGLFLFGDWLLTIYIFKGMLKSWKIAIFYWIYLLPNVVTAITQVLMVTWLTFITKLFEVINNAADKFVKSDEFNNCSNEEFLINYLKVHKMLMELVKEVNKLYAFQLFLFILYNYIILLSNGYFILHNLIFQTENQDQNKRILIFFIKGFIQAVFNYCFIAKHIVNLSSQVSILFVCNEFNMINIIVYTD